MGSVLVVDDNKAFCEVISAVLQDANLNVTALNDPLHALRWVRTKKLEVEVAFVDQRMPLYSGAEFMGRLHLQRPNALGILVTGYEVEGTLTQAHQGFFDYIAKPFSNEDMLFRVFRSLVAQRLHQMGFEVSVFILDKFNGPLTPSIRRLVKRSLQESNYLVLSHIKEGQTPSTGSLPTDTTKGNKVIFCHRDFLSTAAKQSLDNYLSNSRTSPQVVKINSRSWRDIRSLWFNLQKVSTLSL